MSLWRLVIKEILMRKLPFATGVFSVAVAVGVLVVQLTLLDAHDLRTDQILEAKRAKLQADMDKMEDDYRKIMKKLGFNLLILPEGQKLDDFHATGYAERDMPESHVDTLLKANLMTVRHLMPSLEQRIRWPEQANRVVILVGTRGEEPLSHGAQQEPILNAVDPGTAVLGFEIGDSLGLAVGDKVTLMGRTFKVAQCHDERGTKDDVTIWIDLAEAQELLGRPGRINAILALKCLCAGSDLPSLRKSIGSILPGVQVIELSGQSVVREDARQRASAAATEAIAQEADHRARMRREREEFAAWLVPVVTLGAALWIGLLALANVRERKIEIGILRALGVRARQIMLAFLAKAAFLGLLGAAIGYALGFALGLRSGDMATAGMGAAALFRLDLLVGVLLSAPIVSILASWAPALAAARQDPAVVLREE